VASGSLGAVGESYYQTHSVNADDLQQAVATGVLYAIVDATGEPTSVLSIVERLGPERSACLNRGYRAVGTLAREAPYLLQVDQAILDWIRTELWSRSWGFFCLSQAPLHRIAHHWRKYVFVHAPSGKRWKFRFYSPKILPRFIRACDGPETKSLFGPHEALLIFQPGAEEGSAYTPTPTLAEITPQRLAIGRNFPLRASHLAAFRQDTLSNAIIKTFIGTAQTAETEPETGDLLIRTPSDHAPLRVAFDNNGNLGTITSPSGRSWLTQHDPSSGRCLGIATPSGLVLRIEPDKAGRRTAIRRNGELYCTEHHDPLGRLSGLSYPDGTESKIDYRHTDRDRRGQQVTATTNRLGQTERLDYDPAGDLIALTDGLGQSTRYTYGTWNRPERIDHPDGRTEHITYTAKGQVAQVRSGSAVVDVTYTKRGFVEKLAHEGTEARFAYDDQGRIVRAVNPEATLNYTYDDTGRLSEERTQGQRYVYHYDTQGNIAGLSYPSGERLCFELDADQRLVAFTDWAGQRYSLHSHADDAGWDLLIPTGFVFTRQLNAAGYPVGQTVRSHPEAPALSERVTSFDTEDRITAIADSRLGSLQYAYDAEGQVLSVAGVIVETFAYDSAGNRTEVNGKTVDFKANQLTTARFDERGNRIAQGTWRYTFNARNQLISATSDAVRLTYGYDAFGRRLWKRVDRSESGGIVRQETRTVWLGEQRIKETVTEQRFQAGGEVVISGLQTRHTTDYLYWPGSHTPCLMRRHVPGRGSHIYLYETDHLGSPVRLWDQQGQIVWEARYRAYGDVEITVNEVTQPLRFPGHYHDEETGLHENRFRYYDPASGRYLSPDPLGPLNDLNPYRYARNNPINQADPLGLYSLGRFLRVAVPVVAAVAVAVAVVTAPIAIPSALLAVTAGALAGATFAGLNEALNQQTFCLKCIGIAAFKGLAVGAIATEPFIFLPATAGVEAFAGVGGLSGAIGYVGDWLANDHLWSWPGFASAVGLGMLMAGGGRFATGKLAQRRTDRAAQALTQEPTPNGLTNASNSTKNAASTQPAKPVGSQSETAGCPVSLVSGEELLGLNDFTFEGPLSLTWRRFYRSGRCDTARQLGHGWFTPLDEWLEIGERVAYHTAEGQTIDFPLPAIGDYSLNLPEHLRLYRDEQGSRVVGRNGLVRVFAGSHGHCPLRAWQRNGCVTDTDDRVIGLRSNWGQGLLIEWVEDRISALRPAQAEPHGLVATGAPYVLYHYSPEGDLTGVFNRLNAGERYTYRQHLLQRRTLASGFNLYFEWDSRGPGARCLRNWGEDGIYATRFVWDDNGRSQAIDSRGGITTWIHNAEGLLLEKRSPEGRTTHFEYNDQNLLSARRDANGTTKFSYDVEGRLVCWTDALGQTETFAYDEHNQLVKTTDALRNCWTYAYDAVGRLVEQQTSDGAVTKLSYNAQGLPVIVTDALGGKRTLLWDEHSRLIGEMGVDGLRQRYRYDADDRIVAAITQDRLTTHYKYDPLGRLVALTDPSGATVKLRYNALDALTHYTDPTGATTEYRYDAGLSQISARIDPAGRVLRYGYDTERNLISLTNAKGEVYRLGYDLDENLIEEIGFDGRHRHYDYTPGNHLQRVHEAQATTTFARDPLGRLLRRTGPDNVTSRFRYDPLGRLVLAENPVSRLRFAYDPLGRLREEQQNGQCLTHRYDLLGRRTETITPTGEAIAYRYSARGHLSEVAYAGQPLCQHHYDELGREISRSQGTLESRYDYDVLGRLRRHTALSQGGNAVLGRDYRYDRAGKLTTLDDLRRGQRRYFYDPSERLLSVSGITPEQFVHDPAGNLLGVPEAPGEVQGDRLWMQGDRHFVYDEAGNRIEERRGKRQALITRYTYDGQHRLIRVTGPSGEVSTYEYDALGRRIAKQTPLRETRFVYDGPRLLSETTAETTRTYLFEPEGFRPLARVDRTATTEPEIYYYHLDHLGTPHELTNTADRIVWSARYRAYGALAMKDGELIDNPLRFQGQYYDQETGLHYNLHRYYDPQTGGFLTQDPIGLAGGAQLYQYVPNPVAWVDPYGLACKETYYRTLSKQHYDQLTKTGKLPATSETFISPTESFSQNYNGALVRFDMKPGTTDALAKIGVRDTSPKAVETYPDMPVVSKGWNDFNAFFKGEGEQINIGLGRGAGLDTFNSLIEGLTRIR
jgi:RHS repeat-associated protein